VDGGAAPIVDPKGDIWVSVGNGSSTSSTGPYDYSDSMLDLSANLHLRQYFAPSSWAQDNASDLDMSMAPALLANGQVVVSGKSRIIYLLNGAHLGGIGHEESSLASGCSQDIDGGPALSQWHDCRTRECVAASAACAVDVVSWRRSAHRHCR
jgi:hypothetical protein